MTYAALKRQDPDYCAWAQRMLSTGTALPDLARFARWLLTGDPPSAATTQARRQAQAQAQARTETLQAFAPLVDVGIGDGDCPEDWEVEALDAVSVGGPAPELPALPNLVVDGAAVGLPLDAASGAALYATAAPSPHGVGTQTSYDTTVRRSREFVKDRFSVQPKKVQPRVCLRLKPAVRAKGGQGGA